MSGVAVRVEKLGKQYHIGGPQQQYKTLRDSLSESFLNPLKRMGKLIRGQAYGASDLNETIWALRDVSFEVQAGEVMGIVGRNGAGKSTLLKILSSITEPTEGFIDLYGRVGALLEVGTGFHPELTGRENIYLNAAILGMSRAEINRKFDEIVAFAEVEKFIDTPVKHYSSGMGLRLGFAVAAHLDPDILVVDEVLAVGDAAFQKKCLGRMEKVAYEGRTVLFVSHNMNAIQSLCKTALWLNGGTVVKLGPADEIVAEYFAALQEGSLNIEQGEIEITKFVMQNGGGQATTTFEPGDDIEILIHYHVERRIDKPNFWLSIRGASGVICNASMLIDGHQPEFIEGDGVIGCRFLGLPLLPQTYSLWMGVRDKHSQQELFPAQEITAFSVIGDVLNMGLMGARALRISDKLSLLMPYEWQFPDGTNIRIQVQRPQREMNIARE